MLAKVFSATNVGLDGVIVEVEVDVANRGFPTFTIVGLPNKSVDESKDRVRTAITNAGYEMPDSRITVNLAPADIPKIGSSFDLPIALGILASSGIINSNIFGDSIFVGELSLEGKVREVPGIISVALLAREKNILNLFVPEENADEAAMIKGISIYPVKDLQAVIKHLNGEEPLIPFEKNTVNSFKEEENTVDFADIKGQEQAKRALEIAAAGFHNVHLKGVPGAGKTMLAKSLPGILPLLEDDEVLEVMKIYSVSGMLNNMAITNKRPFRAPHHTTSRIGLIGGGSHPMPGEISLAHRGVLFLDEFPEFPRVVLESLRQPIEDGIVTISRAAGSLTFPCKFLLFAASNPCPCGYRGHPKKKCSCMPGSVTNYKKRLSGPLLDRIDIHLDIAAVDEDKLMGREEGEASVVIRKRIEKAREIQKKRFKNASITFNSEMSSADIKKYCTLDIDASTFLKQAINKFSLSARSYFRIIKVAQTIADLEGSDNIQLSHIAEVLQYRVKEDK